MSIPLLASLPVGVTTPVLTLAPSTLMPRSRTVLNGSLELAAMLMLIAVPPAALVRKTAREPEHSMSMDLEMLSTKLATGVKQITVSLGDALFIAVSISAHGAVAVQAAELVPGFAT